MATLSASLVKASAFQEWGQRSWEAADASPIEADDVDLATSTAVAALDESFFRVRFDRLTPKEKCYLRAMAELGPGPHRSGLVAQGRGFRSCAMTRGRTAWFPWRGPER